MAKTVTQTERNIQKPIRAWLVKQGFIVLKLTTMRRYGSAGWPDLLVLDHAPRLPLFLEVKTESGRTTPLQDQRIAELRNRGLPVFVVRSLQEVKIIVEAWLEYPIGGVGSR